MRKLRWTQRTLGHSTSNNKYVKARCELELSTHGSVTPRGTSKETSIRNSNTENYEEAIQRTLTSKGILGASKYRKITWEGSRDPMVCMY